MVVLTLIYSAFEFSGTLDSRNVPMNPVASSALSAPDRQDPVDGADASRVHVRCRQFGQHPLVAVLVAWISNNPYSL